MASGTLASLGLGSEVLTNETLEKLKQADESARIKPYETKIETNSAKQKALTELTTKLASFQSVVSSLGDSTAFGKRKVTASVTGDSAAATLTASNGVSVQNLSVKVEQIAQKDVYQSKGITKDTDRVLLTGQQPASFTIMQNGKEYTIKVEANTTYSDLADKINSATDGNVIAKVVSTGEKGTPYRFTLSSKETGADNAISFFAGTKNGATGNFETNQDSITMLSNLGWVVSNSVAEADMKGFTFTGGTRASNVTNLNDAIGQDIKFTLWAGDEKFEISANATDTYQDLINKLDADTANGGTGKKIKLNAVADSNGNYVFNFVAGDNSSTSTKIKIFDGTLDTATNTYSSDTNTKTFLQDTLKIGISRSYSLSDTNGEYHLKKAQDAEFTLDGVKMYRSKNSITDVGAGITLNLLKAGEINFDIKQDSEGLTSTMEELVEKYNELINYLDEVTSYNTETKVSGDLATVTEVKGLRTAITKMLFGTQAKEGKSTDSSGNTINTSVLSSIIDYGVSFASTENNTSKLLKFDSATFEKKFAEDPDFAQSLFSGTSGFEDINVIGSGSLFADSDFTNHGLAFKDKEFKIVFGDVSYDLTKDTDGNDFTLKGDTPEQRAENLLDHINSFNISGLKVSMQELTTASSKSYALKFNSDDGSDFQIAGDSDLLKKLGLEAKKVSPEAKTGTGIFSQLKTTLQSYTRVSTVDTKKGSLTLYGERLKTEATNLSDEKKKEQEKIDNYYELMFSKWVSYDSIISNIKTQGNAITQMINAANNSNK